MAEYAIIAGKGNLPKLVMAELESPLMICFEGEYDPDLKPDLVTKFGRVGQVVEFMKSHGVKKIIFAGAMQRPDLKNISPDAEGAKLLAKLMAASFFGKSLGDDKLLSTITKYMEEKGFEVVGADEILAALKATYGAFGELKPTEVQSRDIAAGMAILKKIGELDIGQALVIEDGVVLAVEAAEGTEKLIERAGALKKSYGGVLVKCKKPGQDDKVDLPSIGAETVAQIMAAGIAGIAVEAGASLVIEKEKLIEKANSAGVFVVGA